MIVKVYDRGVLIGTETVPDPPMSALNADDLRAKGRAYLALPSPTAAQTTKAVRALVMLQMQALDDTAGT